MTMFRSSEITCQICGHKYRVSHYPSINVTVNPEMKHKIFTKELFTVECNACGHKLYVAYPLLYHDMHQNLMIYVQNLNPNDPNELEAGKGWDLTHDFFSQDYILRIVKDNRHLIEKLLIFDAGLDDGIVEIAKVYYREAFEEEFPAAVIDEMFFYRNKNGSCGYLVIMADGRRQPMSVDMRNFDRIAEDFSEELRALTPGIAHVIDEKWALKVVGTQ